MKGERGKAYIEAHVTLIGDPEELRPKVEETGWTFSCIFGDPNLGPGVKCYATMLFSPFTSTPIKRA